jgi:hypothetical protein
MKHKPLAFTIDVKLPHPSNDDKTADADRLRRELCRIGLDVVDIPLHILKKLPEELRKNRFNVKFVIGVTRHGSRILDVNRDVVCAVY